MSNPVKPKAKNRIDGSEESGWLSPDGRFYECVSWDHENLAWDLARMLGYKDFYAAGRELEKYKWIKLKSGDWLVVERGDLTQKQIDALFDWTQGSGKPIPWDADYDIPISKLVTPATELLEQSDRKPEGE